MADSTLQNVFDTGGGNVQYIFHVSSYPWACSTSQNLIDILDDGSHNAERRKIFGYANISGSSYWADDVSLCQFVPTLNVPTRQTIKLHHGKAQLSGGNFKIEILDSEVGLSWEYAGEAYRGLDGLHRVAQPLNDANIAWGYTRDNFEDSDTSLKVTEQNGNTLYTRIDAVSAMPWKLLWIGQECISASAVTTDSGTTHDLTVTINGRGLFRSRVQHHWGETFSNSQPMVTDVPLSIVDKPCWVWAFVMNSDESDILDGPELIRWGKVGRDIRTRSGVTTISVLPPWEQLNTNITLNKFEANLARFVFSRQSTSGTTDNSVLLGRQAPHLVIREFADRDDNTGSNRNIWLANSGDSWVRTFDTPEDVLNGLMDEIDRVQNGGQANQTQRSGAGTADSPYVTTTYDYYLKFGKLVQEQKSGGTAVTKLSLISGPLAWLMNLGHVRGDQQTAIEELLKYAPDFFYAGTINSDYWFSGAWMVVANAGGHEENGRSLVPYDRWVAKYYVDFDWDDEDLGTWGTGPWIPKKQDTFPIVGGKLYCQPEVNVDDISNNDSLYLGRPDSSASRPRYCKFTATGTGTTGDYPHINTTILYSIDGYSTPFFYGTGIYHIPGLYMSQEELEEAAQTTPTYDLIMERTLGNDTLSRTYDPWIMGYSGSESTTMLSGVFRGLLGESGTDIITVPEQRQQLQIVGFLDVDRGTNEYDFRSMIDWANLDEMATKILSNQIYVCDLSDKVNLYRMLMGELQFHGIHPTYEWDGSLGQFMIRFRRLGPTNITNAFFEGRTITEDDIIYKSDHETNHTLTWLYNKIEASFNAAAGEAKAKIAVDYVSGNVIGITEDKVLKIQSHLSHVKGLQDISPLEAQKVAAYFADNLKYLSMPVPTIKIKNLLSTTLSCGVGKDILVTDSTMRSPGTYEPGVSESPALVLAQSIDLSTSRGSTTFMLTDDYTYGWAPAARITSGTKPHPTLGVNYIKATVDPHYFSSSTGREDQMWFDCYEWSKTSNTYTAKSCSCSDYTVNLYERNNPSASVLVFDVVAVREDNTIDLYDSSGTHYTAYDAAEEYIMTYQDYDNCEDCQKKFVFLADDDDKLGSSNALGQRWV